jgi:hypothetical protein
VRRIPVIALVSSLLTALPAAFADEPVNIAVSDATFQEAIKAYKSKNFVHAYALFEMQAQAAQHDAQYNLALLLKTGRGTPQHYPDALMWSWLSYLGGIEKAKVMADDILDKLNDDSVAAVREKVAERLKARIDGGDKQAVMQFALYHLEIAAETDYQKAYFWYSIAAALGLEGGQQGRDAAADELSSEQVLTTQEEARSAFYGLSFGK